MAFIDSVYNKLNKFFNENIKLSFVDENYIQCILVITNGSVLNSRSL